MFDGDNWKFIVYIAKKKKNKTLGFEYNQYQYIYKSKNFQLSFCHSAGSVFDIPSTEVLPIGMLSV